MKIDGVDIYTENFPTDDMPDNNELKNYVAYAKKHVEYPIKKIVVKLCDDGEVDLQYVSQDEKFERIRRITGYLVGTTDRWNDAKKAEERERVKHF